MKARWDTQAIRESVPIARALVMLDASIGSHGRTRCPIPGCTPSSTGRKDEFSYSRAGWHCFRCSNGGDVFDLVRLVLGTDFRGAVSWFEGRGVELKKSYVRPKMSLEWFWAMRRDSANRQWAVLSNAIMRERDVLLRKIETQKSAGQLDEVDSAMLVSMAHEAAERKWYDLDIAMGRMVDNYRKELRHAWCAQNGLEGHHGPRDHEVHAARQAGR